MAATTDRRDAEAKETKMKGKFNSKFKVNSNNDKDSKPSIGDLQMLLKCQKQFQKGRKIAIKNIPVTTKEEVDLFLGEYKLKEIELNCKEKEAIVTLENGQDAESIIEELHMANMLDHTISICILATDRLLCLAHLPLGYADDDLTKLVSPLGPVLKSFLFRAEDTGESKGYGLVEFADTQEKSKKIASELDWRQIEGCKIHCDIVNQKASLSFSRLHSRCLLVDNLPQDYKDNSNFRELFSRKVSPIYCQVVLKQGEPLGYGIIEYSDWKDAQQTQRLLNGYKLHGTALRVTYCIPGKSAVEICTRLLTKYDETSLSSKPSLLPDPIFPNPTVLSHPLVTDLCDQHPQLMTNFKAALHQLQQTYVSQLNLKSAKPGLLGPAPSLGMSPLMNPNMQLGLMILLGLQIQARSQNVGPLNLLTLLGSQGVNEKPSLLGDPVSAQATIILQNLMSQIPPSSGPDGSATRPKPTSEETPLSLLQSLAVNIQNLNLSWLTNLGQLTASMQFRQQIDTKVKPLMNNDSMPVAPAPADFQGHFDSGMTKSRPSSGLLGEAPGAEKTKLSKNFMKNIELLAAQSQKLKQSNELNTILEDIQHCKTGLVGNSQLHGKGLPSLLGEPPVKIAKKSPILGGAVCGGLLPEPGRVSSTLVKDTGQHSQGDYNRNTYDDQRYGSMGGDNSSRDDSGYGGYGRHGSSSGYNYSDSSFNSGRGDSSFNSQVNSSLTRSGSTSSNYDRGYDSFHQYDSIPASDPDYENMAAQAIEYAAASNTSYRSNQNRHNSDCEIDYYSHSRGNHYSNSYNYNNASSDIYRNGSYHVPSGQDLPSHSEGRLAESSSLLGTPQGRSTVRSDHLHSHSRYGTEVVTASSLLPKPTTNSLSSHPLLATPSSSSAPSHALLSTPGGSSPHPLLKTPPGISPHPEKRSIGGLLGEGPKDHYSVKHTAKALQSSQAEHNSLLGSRPAAGRGGLLKTPGGQKRSYSHLLPAPEPSPETDYVGQHSQGIGGHYADSYPSRKRQRLDATGTSRRYSGY